MLSRRLLCIVGRTVRIGPKWGSKSPTRRINEDNDSTMPSKVRLLRGFAKSNFDPDDGFRCTSARSFVLSISPQAFTELFHSVRKGDQPDFIILDVRSPGIN